MRWCGKGILWIVKQQNEQNENSETGGKWKIKKKCALQNGSWFVLHHLNLHFKVSSYSLCQDTQGNECYFFHALPIRLCHNFFSAHFIVSILLSWFSSLCAACLDYFSRRGYACSGGINLCSNVTRVPERNTYHTGRAEPYSSLSPLERPWKLVLLQAFINCGVLQ